MGRGRSSWGEAVANERSALLFERLYAVAKEQRCHGVVLAGDIFDAKSVTNAERELVLAALVRHAGKGGTPTYISTGNHDLTSTRGSNLDLLAILAASKELPNLHVTFADKASVWPTAFEGLHIVGAPVGLSEHQEAVEETVRTLPKDQSYVFVGHGTVGGAVRNDMGWRPSEAEDAKRLSLNMAAKLAPHVVYWAYGDIHKRQALPSLPAGVKGFYAGSPIPMDFSEQADRGVLVVAFDRDEKTGSWSYTGKRYVRIDTPDSGFAPLVTVTQEEDLNAVPEQALIRLGNGLILSAKRRDQVVKQFKVVQDHSTPEAAHVAQEQTPTGGALEVFDPLLADQASVERHVLAGLTATSDATYVGEGRRIVGLAVERYRNRVYVS